MGLHPAKRKHQRKTNELPFRTYPIVKMLVNSEDASGFTLFQSNTLLTSGKWHESLILFH